jgi:restriction system protein
MQVPRYSDFHWPILEALAQLGGSANIDELNERVAHNLHLSEDVLAVPHGDGSISEVEYRLAWARTYLKKAGALDNGSRGVWSLTAEGRRFTKSDAADVSKRVRAIEVRSRSNTPNKNAETQPPSEISWKEQLLAILKDIHPTTFERLCQRILRESGFTKVEVTGKSGDGGIDGAGVLRMNLVSFHVLFQCKRWKDAVPSSVIRDFRGSMVGRADKGLIITTGRFTLDAQKEAVRDGAPAIDLIELLPIGWTDFVTD